MKKRKSRGRSKGSRGHSGSVQCSSCGRMVPVDKAKRSTSRHRSIVSDPQLAKELEAQGAYIEGSVVDKYYCISCAIRRGICRIRDSEERKNR